MSPGLSSVSGLTSSPLTFTVPSTPPSASSPATSCDAVAPFGIRTSSGCIALASSVRVHVMTMTLSSLTEIDGLSVSSRVSVPDRVFRIASPIAACNSAAASALKIGSLAPSPPAAADSFTSFATPACAMAKMGLSTSPERHSASLRARLARRRVAFAASPARAAESLRSSRACASACSTVRLADHRFFDTPGDAFSTVETALLMGGARESAVSASSVPRGGSSVSRDASTMSDCSFREEPDPSSG
mmetsp:Transcript_7078/g.19311  ORF Transcript_7078/g.19311 Transcript_7078/m.19311 type:complete len:246 (-) Transcript_7078:3481-4218(-)